MLNVSLMLQGAHAAKKPRSDVALSDRNAAAMAALNFGHD
jgi:hypothetical protein